MVVGPSFEPTGLMGLFGPSLGLLATYRSYAACWTQFGAVCWQPTRLMGLIGPSFEPTGFLGLVGPSLGLYVGSLQVLWGLLDPAWGCMLATYMFYRALPSLRLYVGNLHVLWGLMDPAWGCMLATYSYRSYGACWTQLGAACWQPTSLMGFVGKLGAVCWQPTGLMGLVGPSLGLYVGNLQVLWGLLGPAWGCMLATYSSYGACWTQLGAVYWQPTCHMGLVGPSLGAVCWQPTCLMWLVGPSLRLYVGNLQV